MHVRALLHVLDRVVGAARIDVAARLTLTKPSLPDAGARARGTN